MGTADSRLLAYKPHIDGLRALAVLSVIAFHFSKTTLPGGYLGVDSFFVISGYLITGIIWEEMLKEEYSLARFYERRVRRILPALLLVLVLSTIIGTVLLLPADLIGFGKSIVATLFFSANIYFWRDGDYFGRIAEEKPLLHMWSLGVEEQFYILFPLLLAVLAKWWRAQTLYVIAALTAASYVANVVLLRHYGDNPAFFLLPTRAWELGVGAIVALAPEHWSRAPGLMRPLGFLGLFLLAASMFFPIRPLPFIPEATAAVIGSGLVIFTARTLATPVAGLFAAPPLVFVGLVSYSLYLWHWPTIVFARYYLVRDLTPLETSAATVFIFAGATLSWRFVERPFRNKKLAVGRVLSLTGGAAAAVALAGVAFVAMNGLPSRLNGAAATINASVGTNWRCPVSELLPFGASRACGLNLPSRDPRDAEVGLIGNSHAQMYAPLVTRILHERGETGLLIPLAGCLPSTNINVSVECAEAAKSNLEALEKLPKVRRVIIATTWMHKPSEHLVTASGEVVDNSHGAGMIVAMDDLADRLLRLGKGVTIIGPIARPGWDVASITGRQIAFGWNGTRKLYVDRREFDDEIGAAIAHFSARSDIGFITPHRIQCNLERCDFLIDGHSLYADSNHLAAPELERFLPAFESLLP